MASFTISLNMDNAAFDVNPITEVNRILYDITKETSDWSETSLDKPFTKKLRDINGNMVGFVQYKNN